MTLTEWTDTMTRYMHRSDLSGDLTQALDFAQQQFDDAWLGALPYDGTQDDLLDLAGNAMTHAGLMWLHDLAQDNEQLAKERNLFSVAVKGLMRRVSYTNTPFAVMTTPEAVNSQNLECLMSMTN
mgnify:CR=1 FL=1